MKSGVTIIRKKQGMKSLIKKLVELQHLSVTVGIHSGAGRRLVKDPDGRQRKAKFNIAMLAKNLETWASWIQNKTVSKKFGNGTYINFEKGRRYKRSARPFVSLKLVPDYWGSLREYIRQQVRMLVLEKGVRPRIFIGSIGNRASELQKSVITSGKSEPNAEATYEAKGKKNTPLIWSGINNLVGALTSKIVSAKSGLGKSGKAELKMQDADYIDKLIKKLNSKG